MQHLSRNGETTTLHSGQACQLLNVAAELNNKTQTLMASDKPFSLKLFLHRIALIWTQWQHNRRSRQQLAQLSEYLLEDIGLDRCQVNAELEKPFWRD